MDRIVIVEQDFQDQDSEQLEEAADGTAIEIIHKPWLDCFSCQRNRYLSAIRDGWVLVSDPDEWFSDEALKQLRDMIEYSQFGSHYNTVCFNSVDTTYSDDWKQVLHSQRASDHKPLLFKRYGGQHYIGLVHEDMSYPPGVARRLAYASPECSYEHVKTKLHVCERAVGNFFMGGGGMNDLGQQFPEWKNLRAKLELELGITSWTQFQTYLETGNVAPWLKNWILRYRNWNDIPNIGSEVRKLFHYYMERLHPEENLESVKSDFAED